MLTVNIITLFPELFDPFLNHLPLSRAVEKQKIKINLVDLKDFAIDRRGTVDSRPYGGGVGMLLRIEPVWKALEHIYNFSGGIKKLKKVQENPENSIVALSPSGIVFKQHKARDLSKKSTITFICGRYEGLDARIKDHLATEVISLGNFVLSGGEIPALAIIESITRLLPEVIKKDKATKIESFSKEMERGVEYPQYTRPQKFKELEVPNVLLSGNHAEIQKWREESRKPIPESNN